MEDSSLAMSLPMERRSKTVTPDIHKDERYWERRGKNNVAAKKSRDNRRTIESAIRRKAFELEKDNMFLRRELSLFKARFGIPENRGISTPVYRKGYNKMASESPKLSLPRSYFSTNTESVCRKVGSRQTESESVGSYRRPSSTEDDDQGSSGEDVCFYTNRCEPGSSFCSSSPSEEESYGEGYDDVPSSSLYEDCNNTATDLSMKKRARSVEDDEIVRRDDENSEKYKTANVSWRDQSDPRYYSTGNVARVATATSDTIYKDSDRIIDCSSAGMVKKRRMIDAGQESCDHTDRTHYGTEVY